MGIKRLNFIRNLTFGICLLIGWHISATEVPSLKAAWDLDFPDPSVLKSQDGFYYAYATQTISEDDSAKLFNIQVARSKDLKTWEHLGDALPTKPSWAHTTQKFWAPDVKFHNGKYYLYYSAEPDSQDGLCVAVATSNSPQGPFADIGHPLVCGPGFENIDPMMFEDPQSGKDLLVWGSGFGPLKVQQLADDLISFATNTQPTPLVLPQPNSAPEKYMRLVEGSWMEYRDGNYFLFFSGDNCCDSPHYAVMIAKSKSPFGPFELLEQETHTTSVILDESAQFTGPGHNAVITDDAGRSWIFYHAINRNHSKLRFPIPGDREVRRVLMKSRLCWPTSTDGWPWVSATTTCN